MIPALTNHRPARAAGATHTERRVRKVLLALAHAVNHHTQTTTIDADDVHPHALRHAYALRYLREHPGSLGRLRELLGHADITTTAKYLAAITDDGPPIDAWELTNAALELCPAHPGAGQLLGECSAQTYL